MASSPTILLLAAALLPGCGQKAPTTSEKPKPVPQATSAPGPAFTQVRIASMPQGWGSAHKTVEKDGTITGAHMSGEPNAVRVYQTKSSVSAADMAALNDLVRKVPTPASSPPMVRGHTYVVITRPDGTTATFGAAWEQKFESAEVQAIWDLLHKYNVGAW